LCFPHRAYEAPGSCIRASPGSADKSPSSAATAAAGSVENNTPYNSGSQIEAGVLAPTSFDTGWVSNTSQVFTWYQRTGYDADSDVMSSKSAA